MGQSLQFEKVQFGAETSAYGTETSSYSPVPRTQSSNLTATNNNIYDRGLGEGVNASNTYYGPFDTSGDVTFNVVDFTFLQHWVGSRTGSGTSGSHYLLTEATSVEAAALAVNKLVPFSFEKQNNDTENTVFFATGCVGTTFSLTGSINSVLSCSANFIGQKLQYRQTTTSYTPDLDPAYTMIAGTWKWGASPSALAGVRDFTINYDNQLVGAGDETRTIESRFRTIPKLGQRSYTGTVSIIMTQALATTIINDFMGSESGGVYSPEDGSTAISPTSSLEFHVDLVNASKNAQIHLNELAIDNISKPASLGGGLSLLTFEFTAREASSNVFVEWWE